MTDTAISVCKRLKSIVARAVVTILLLGCGLWTAKSWSFLFSPPRADQSEPVIEHEGGQLQQLFEDNGGTWSFASAAISANARHLSGAEFKLEIGRRGQRKIFLPNTVDFENQVIQWLVNLRVPTVELENGRVFESLQGDFWTYAETVRLDAVERISAARLGFRSGENWMLLEFAFHSDNVSGEMVSNHLLPVPETARRICARTSRDGHLLLEVFNLQDGGHRLIADWETAGWTAHRESVNDIPFGMIHCQRGREFITAVATTKDSSPSMQLVLLNRTKIR